MRARRRAASDACAGVSGSRVGPRAERGLCGGGQPGDRARTLPSARARLRPRAESRRRARARFRGRSARRRYRPPEVALASGKLLRPGARLIDSAGIVMGRSRRFRDRGSEQPDDGSYGEVETVFAVSGAALMLRRRGAALPRARGRDLRRGFLHLPRGYGPRLARETARLAMPLRACCPGHPRQRLAPARVAAQVAA